MVDSEYVTYIYKSLKIGIGTLIKNPEMITFIPDYLKTKNICKYAVKKLSFEIRCVPGQYKIQGMCDKAVVENGGTLQFVPDNCKNQKMCNQAVDNDVYALKYVPEALNLKKYLIKLLTLILL